MLRSGFAHTACILVLICLAVLPAHSGPTIGTLHPSGASRVGQRFELTFTLTDIRPQGSVFPSDGNYGYNPFCHDTTVSGPVPTAPGVNVWADITLPGGSNVRVDGFWCVEYRYLGEARSGFDRIVPVNHPHTGTAEHWHVRFIPPVPGYYSVTVYADDPDPQSGPASATESFNVAGSLPDDRGMLEMTGDGARFQYANGTPYCQFGFVMPQGCGAVSHQPVLNGKSGLDVLAAAGGNYVRRWLVNTHREDIYRGISWHAGANESTDETVSRSGRRSVRVSAASGPGIAVNRSLIGCLPGREYTARIWFRGALGTTGNVRMVVGEDNGTTESPRAGDWLSVGEEWQEAQLRFTTGTGAKWLHFKPEFSGGTGEVYLDDADLRDTTPGSAVDFCMIQNPSFEYWSPVQLDAANLWRADYFLQACERLGIFGQLVLFDYRLWDPVTGFFTASYGDTFWGDMSAGAWRESESVRQQKRLLRYVAARYGGYPSLGFWELTNEMSPSWSAAQYEWLKNISSYLRSVDTADGRPPGARPITNSFWKSPASVVGYEQIPTIPVNSAHYYIYTDTHPDMRSRTPGWGIRRENVDNSDPHSPPLSYHVALDYGYVKAEDNIIEKTIGTRPGRFYKLKYWVKASEMTGNNPQVRVQYFRHDAFGAVLPSGSGQQTVTPPVGWCERELAWQAGQSDADVNIRFQLVNIRSGEVWFDDMQLLESTDGVNWRDRVYNSDLTLTVNDDDELIWALQNAERSSSWYRAGPNGMDRAWVFGEFGLYAWSTSLGTWACSPLAASDTTGIHSHNAVWAQMMISGAVSSPIYWFTEMYLLAHAAAGRDVYTPTWSGISDFVARLPFHSESQLICTEPYYSEVPGVQSSDSLIRAVGRKKGDTAYFWVSNATNTWANRVLRGEQAVPATATVAIPGFESGNYLISNRDSWGGGLISETRVMVGADGVLRVRVDDLSADTAFMVIPTESYPLPPENGMQVDLWNMVVTSGSADSPGICVASGNRTWGAEVVGVWGVDCARGDRVHVRGTCHIENGRRQLLVNDWEGDCFEVCGSGLPLKPVGMLVRNLRGIFKDDLDDAGTGLNNASMLVTCWGTVQYTGYNYFCFHDNSAPYDVWAYTPIGVSVEPGDSVSVTGINSTFSLDYQIQRLLHPRDAADVVVVE